MREPRRAPEPLQVIKQRRDTTLRALVDGVPYIQFLGIQFERSGDELTGILPFDQKLIGNPLLPAIHGGVTAAFLELRQRYETEVCKAYGHRPMDEAGALGVSPGTQQQIAARVTARRMINLFGNKGEGAVNPFAERMTG